ncbi:MAG: hypothetical protein HY394_00035 [Candidatus Diapherotrites archaeon]|nr:hypothetical protein [Candidatus Diapherotrites archaeon]
MKVNELKPKSAVPEITLEIVSKGESRDFASDRGSGKVCNCAAKDETGEISLTLWNEQTDTFEEGDKVKIENGWVSEYKGKMQLGTGRMGTISKV